MKTRTKFITLSLTALLLLLLVPALVSAQAGHPDPVHSLSRTLTETAATTLHMEPEAFVQALQAGKTPTELADEAGVPAEALAAALQETWNAEGVRIIDQFMQKGLPDRKRDPDCRRQEQISRRWLEAAAETLGLTPGEFVELLRTGSAPAEIAAGYDSSGQALIDAIIAVEKEHLDQAVAQGQLTPEQADDILAQRAEIASKWVETGENPLSASCKRQAQIGRRWLRIAAETADMPVRDFAAAMRQGQTPAEIAAARGSSGQAIIDAIVADAKTRLDQAVAEGRLTQEQADARLAEISEKARRWVENGPPPRPENAQPGQ